MKKNFKVIIVLLFVLSIAITAFISFYLTKYGIYLKDESAQLIGSYSIGEVDKPNALVYLAITRSTDDNDEESLSYIEYNVSNEVVLKEGMCLDSDNGYLILFDEQESVYAYLIYYRDRYLLLSNEGVDSLSKISEGTVLPSTY